MKTEHALAVALKDMMSHQPIDTISVLQLSKKCGVSRKTFYYHYHDIYDLLAQVFLEEKIVGINNTENYKELIEVVFNYYKSNEKFINATINSAGKELFFEFIYNAFYTTGLRFISKIDVDKKLSPTTRKSISRFYAYGYGHSAVYYLSNYRHKTLQGLYASFNFIEPKNFEKNVQKAIKNSENV
ncbi:MAG: TetR/AcrR family transcriptional regulator C-terminal domain-containing protein [Bacilli bacterium]|nr:TetR/AcrR family transcriptional regulator C-terminal domain-containing protein [Bacilli bacterium]